MNVIASMTSLTLQEQGLRTMKPKYKIVKKGLTDTSQAPRGKNIYYRCESCKECV